MIAHIEGFLCLSEALIVVLAWNYFERLWCLYELACFLVTHNPALVEMAFDSFLTSSPSATLPKFVHAVESISVKAAQCVNPKDHVMLEEKVKKYYAGNNQEECFANFERFAKKSSIALMAKSMLYWRARRTVQEVEDWYVPWIDLCKRLCFHDLEDALLSADPVRWFGEACHEQTGYQQRVEVWFQHQVCPVLAQEKRLVVRKKIVESASMMMQKISSNASNMINGSSLKAPVGVQRLASAGSEIAADPASLFEMEEACTLAYLLNDEADLQSSPSARGSFRGSMMFSSRGMSMRSVQEDESGELVE